MLRQVLAVMLVFVLAALSGCEGPIRKHQIDVAKLKHPERERIVGVTTLKGEVVMFDQGASYVCDGILDASVKQSNYEVALKDVQRVWVERQGMSTAAKVGLAAGVVVVGLVVVAVIALATKGSCPFVYSWDGTEYVFDAEPYGGAIARGLERDDYAELAHLRAQDGTYRLLLTNEVDETQMTDLMELWVVDHPAAVRVGADEFGKLYSLRDAVEPVSAAGAEGQDLLRWLRAKDRLIWEPPAEPDAHGNVRQQITLTFPKPYGARTVKLVASVATGLWGSYMIKQMVQLRGKEMGAWYRAIDEDPAARLELMQWNFREEMFLLKVLVEESDGWVQRGILPGAGPILAADRVIPLDVSRVRGSQLRIRIRPPVGCWALNAFTVDYSVDAPLTVTRVAAASARDRRGRSVQAELAAADGRYYHMPTTGDRAHLTFPAPEARPDLSRTVLLHSRGYYKLHLDERAAPDLVTLNRIMSEPGAGADFAVARYKEWKAPGGRVVPRQQNHGGLR